MKLEDQVCSLELAKKLKELGVKQESLFSYSTNDMEKKDECYQVSRTFEDRNGFYYPNVYAAFTVAELGEMLPKLATSWKSMMGNWYCEVPPQMEGVDIHAETEADVRAKMLIYLLENNLIDNK